MEIEAPRSPSREDRVDAAIAEYLMRVESGAEIDRAEWLEGHSDIADELRGYLADQDEVGAMAAFRALQGERERDDATVDLPSSPAGGGEPDGREFGHYRLYEQ